MKINMSDIIIKPSFRNSIPNLNKIEKCKKHYLKYGKQDREIVLNAKNELVDGYIMYLVLKKYGEKENIEVKVCNQKRKHKRTETKVNIPCYRKQLTPYIFGIHLDDVRKKEYVWRVPNSWNGWERDLLPGDTILVKTKYGIAPIIITKIAYLENCPVGMPVKKVVRKL